MEPATQSAPPATPGKGLQITEKAIATYDAIVARGVGVEDRVGLFLDRSFEYLVAMLATLKAGAAFVPLDPLLAIRPLGRLLEFLLLMTGEPP